MGEADSGRDHGDRLPSTSLGRLAGATNDRGGRDGSCTQGEDQGKGQGDGTTTINGSIVFGQHSGADAEPLGDSAGPAARGPGDEGREAPQGGASATVRDGRKQELVPDGGATAQEQVDLRVGCPAEVDMNSPGLSEGAETEEPSKVLRPETASFVEHQAWSLVPRVFQEVVSQSRPFLLEVTSTTGSTMTQAVQAVTGRSGAAIRCATSDGHDLSTNEGIRSIIEKLDMLRPLHVWLHPPSDAFCNWQNANQKSTEQLEALGQKRKQVMKFLVGCGVVIGACIQRGVHVSLQMPDQNNAWRLPVLQNIQKQHNLKTCVTKGCRMNLRGSDQRLSRRGWKVSTTHGRLSELLQAPCVCPKEYQHAQSGTVQQNEQEPYTKEFTRQATKAILQEHSYVSVLQELNGRPELPEVFGQGVVCSCERQRRTAEEVPCGACLVSPLKGPRGSEEFEDEGLIESSGTGLSLETEGPKQPEDSTNTGSQQAPEQEQEAHFCTEDVQLAEHKAQEFLRLKQLEHTHCEELIRTLPRMNHTSRPQAQAPKGEQKLRGYYTFGLYSYGKFCGITRLTRMLPQCNKFFQKYLQHHLPRDQRYTSYVVNRNMYMGLHKDNNNDEQYPNCIIGVSHYTGGQLWVEGKGTEPIRKPVTKVLPDGSQREGNNYDAKHKVVQFPPKAWHGTEVWQGDRLVLSTFVSRSHGIVSRECRKELQLCGFRLPVQRKQHEQVMTVDDQPLSKQERERVKKQLYLLHAASGHGSSRHLVEALRRRGVHPEVLELAKEFKCSICEERRRVQPKHLSSLEPLPPKWHCVSADIGHFYNAHKKEHVQFMVVIDEGSRFRAARVLTSGSKQQPTAAQCLEFLRDGWISIFGTPRTLRLDPAGAFRGATIEEFCDRHQIYLDIIPGEAHWKISVVEQAIQGIKELMQKLLLEESDLETREALAVAVQTFNRRETIRGFTPAQHAMGQSPEASGRFDFSGKAPPPELLVENPSGEFTRSVERQQTAEKALVDWQASQRLLRAAHSRGRRVMNYQPGELVYFWRSQVSGKGRREPGDKHGQFLGPARILATETKRDEEGNLLPTSAIWLVRGRSLIKCAAEQVRRASEREELLESLEQVNPVPWTYTRVAEEIGGNRYQDITETVPEPEWLRAQDPEQQEPPTRRRVPVKRPATAMEQGTNYRRDATENPDTETGPTQRRAGDAGPNHGGHRSSPYSRPTAERGQHWWSTVQETAWHTDVSYWNDEFAAVAVEIPLPEQPRKLEQACRDLPTYFIGSMKRRAVEVSEKRLTPEERELFRSAKMIEVKNFVAAQAFETLPESQRPSKSQAVGMRWILTWKQKEDGSVKPKARAVLLGYQDPSYEHRATTAPVMTRQTRQMVLQIAAMRNWRVAKGDVSGAFLQGREYPDKLYCIPCPEICEALRILAESVTRLKRACYGLVDAPLEWYKTVAEFLEGLNLERTWSDACCWVLRDHGVVVGLISGHVDDFLFTGDEQNAMWQGVVQAIKQRFKWGDWDFDDFVQCGVCVKKTSEGFELSQERYVDAIKEIPINASRKKQGESSTTDREKSQLRALLGAIAWHAQQVAPHLSAEVSLLLSEVTSSNVETIAKANACLRRAKAQRQHVMKIHAFRPEEELGVFGWVDAGSQNRVDGYSTQGIFVGLAPTTLLRGELCQVTPGAWHSNRIDRACRSPGAAEAHAAINGEDAVYFARYQWHELLHGAKDLRAPGLDVKKITGCLITDSRNVYDKLDTATLCIKGAEKRTNIEMIALKESQLQTGLILRWVHSEAQLANTLTKRGNCKEMDLFYQMNHSWRIVEDPSMRSARRRKMDGEEPLSSTRVMNDDQNCCLGENRWDASAYVTW